MSTPRNQLTQFLMSLKYSTIPLQCLNLKVGISIKCLRNWDSSCPCIGTRLAVLKHIPKTYFPLIYHLSARDFSFLISIKHCHVPMLKVPELQLEELWFCHKQLHVVHVLETQTFCVCECSKRENQELYLPWNPHLRIVSRCISVIKSLNLVFWKIHLCRMTIIFYCYLSFNFLYVLFAGQRWI